MDSANDKAVEELQKGLKQMWQAATRGCIVIGGTIKDVYDSTAVAPHIAYTCDVSTLYGNYTNVPISVLKGSQGGNVQMPVVGTDCLITFKANDSNRPQIFSVNQIDKWLITANEIDITANPVKFNNSSNGIPISTDLVTRLNNVENLLNNLIVLYNDHTHILTLTSGTGTAAPTVSMETTTLTPTELSDIASTKVFNDD